jgi:hypothetical protein
VEEVGPLDVALVTVHLLLALRHVPLPLPALHPVLPLALALLPLPALVPTLPLDPAMALVPLIQIIYIFDIPGE